MIRHGKQHGWLSLPVDRLPAWTRLHGIEQFDVVCQPLTSTSGTTTTGSNDSKGAGLVSLAARPPGDEDVLIKVPGSLLLSRDNVCLHAKSDPLLSHILDAASDLTSTTRGAILVFLLLQITLDCPSTRNRQGVRHPFAEYVKFLPLEPLPTSWSDAELDLLEATTLAPAVQAKMRSLYREYAQLRESTGQIRWCQETWWDEIDGLITFEDWKNVDSMYRSRALDMPGIGDCMAPVIDMGNHQSGPNTVSRYEGDHEGNGFLLLRQDTALAKGQEITLTYGEDKGACEMIFSYGFIEDGMDDARDMFLALDIPEDDPLRRAKVTVIDCAPGVRLSSRNNRVTWTSEFVWIICVNEEDGLSFKVAQTMDGTQELQVSWNGTDITGNVAKDLVANMQRHPLWDVFRLRALFVVQGRVERQLHNLHTSEDKINKLLADEQATGARPRRLTAQLRTLEERLLQRAQAELRRQIEETMQLPVVHEYLEGSPSQDEQEDFS